MRVRRLVRAVLSSVLTVALSAALAGPSALLGPAVAAEPPSAAAVDAERTAAYVEAVYDDLFGRLPDAAGTSYWTRALLSGTPRAAVANSITSSEEFRSGLIVDAYDEFLGRGPDAGGLRYWLDQMAHGMTIARMESGFIASDEFWALSGGTAAGWVADLYGAVLGRDPAPSEVSYWVGRLAGGASRGQVALGFLLSTERLTTVVNGYYQWLLDRDLDPSGQRTWVGILQAGGRDEAIIGGIVGSEEYWDLVTGPVDVASLEILLTDEPIPAGTDVPVDVLGLDADRRVVADLTDVATLAVDGDTGWCSPGVCYVSTRAGRHTVTAAWGSLRADAAVTVVPGEPVEITASTWDVVLLAGKAFEVHLSGTDDGGNATTVSPATITSDQAGSCVGSVCTLTKAGEHHLTISASGLTTSLSVLVLGGPYAHLRLDPATATVTSGAGQAYDVWWTDAYGNPTQPQAPLTITVDGAPCPHDACAPTAVGPHTVVATAGSVSTSATLTVVEPGAAASRLFGWGYDYYVGAGASTELPAPLTQVGVDTHWASIAAGSAHTLGITSDGALWGWGDGSWGQLGDGNRNSSATPRRIGTSRWTAVAAAGQHSVGIQADGSLWEWGSGNIHSYDEGLTVPTRVGARTDWTAVATTGGTRFALAADGTLWAWGANANGEIGDGSTTERATPVLVGGGKHWRAVAAGDAHVLAIATDGSLWGWGYNACGDVGDGTTVTRLVPTQIGTGTSWARVSAGACTSVATRTDGTLWSWGRNASGELGLGDRTERHTPTRVGSGVTWATASAGTGVMHAITSNGQLWGWGSGSLGLATANGSDTDDTLSPARIGTDTGWTAVDESDFTVVALRP